jgi:hypothetical protein
MIDVRTFVDKGSSLEKKFLHFSIQANDNEKIGQGAISLRNAINQTKEFQVKMPFCLFARLFVCLFVFLAFLFQEKNSSLLKTK